MQPPSLRNRKTRNKKDMICSNWLHNYRVNIDRNTRPSACTLVRNLGKSFCRQILSRKVMFPIAERGPGPYPNTVSIK